MHSIQPSAGHRLTLTTHNWL